MDSVLQKDASNTGMDRKGGHTRKQYKDPQERAYLRDDESNKEKVKGEVPTASKSGIGASVSEGEPVRNKNGWKGRVRTVMHQSQSSKRGSVG